MVAAPKEGGNILTKETLDEVFELDKTILALEASAPLPVDRSE